MPGRTRIGLASLLGADSVTTAVANVETTNPKDDVLGNVGGVVRDAFEVARGKNELKARAHERGPFCHVLQQVFENAIAISIDDIVTFENLRGHLDVAENERAEAFGDHGTHGGGHRSQFFGNLRALHFAQGDHTLGEIHGEVADALEVIGDFQSSDDEAHFVVGKRTAAEQADGVLIDDNFHFVDAGLEEKHFTGESRGAGTFQANDGVKRAVHGAFDGARHGNEVVHERVVEHDFRKSGSCCHWSPFGAEEGSHTLAPKQNSALEMVTVCSQECENV